MSINEVDISTMRELLINDISDIETFNYFMKELQNQAFISENAYNHILSIIHPYYSLSRVVNIPIVILVDNFIKILKNIYFEFLSILKLKLRNADINNSYWLFIATHDNNNHWQK